MRHELRTTQNMWIIHYWTVAEKCVNIIELRESAYLSLCESQGTEVHCDHMHTQSIYNRKRYIRIYWCL